MTAVIAQRFATYGGDQRHIIGEVKGPNTMGEMLTAVTADYDADSHTTRVGFRYSTVLETVES
jgi:hypothetical protein